MQRQDTRSSIALLLLAITGAALTLAMIWQLTSASDSESDVFSASEEAVPARSSGEHASSGRLEPGWRTAEAAGLEAAGEPIESEEAPRADPDAGASEVGVLASEENARLEEKKVLSQIGEAFASQPVDQAWSTSMIRRLHEHVRAHPLDGSTVDKVECRSSACRIEISPGEGAELEAIRDSFRTEMIDVMSSGASKRDDRGKYILYLGRDPQALGLGAT